MTIALIQAQQLTIRDLQNDPVLLIKESSCKIQVGTIKVIHPINISSIEDAAESLVRLTYQNSVNTNPLTNILRYKTKKLYSNLHQLKPQHHHRSRRWNTIGTIWKWIAGTPDASDLLAINTTMNDLIDQNNQQVKINQNINHRIQELTHAIREITIQANQNDLIMNEIETMTSILNVDILNQLLEDIQDAVMLSKMSITTSKILTIREILTIKGLLQDQGIDIHLPDEALQFVTPKFATSANTLLYFMHVPLLENSTSSIIRIYPIINRNSTLDQYPEYIVKRGDQIFTTKKPKDYVQKFSFLKDLNDECINPMINGRKPKCNIIFNNQTIYRLISDNTLLISNARKGYLESNCGPDNRSLEGNMLIHFENCTIKINNQSFRNEELLSEPEIIHGAFYNLNPDWTLKEKHDLNEIHRNTIQNRRHLEHVYLKQNNLNLKFWSMFGGLSLTGIVTTIIVVFIILKYISNGTGRSSLKGRVVTEPIHPIPDLSAVIDSIRNAQQQQQQILSTVIKPSQQNPSHENSITDSPPDSK